MRLENDLATATAPFPRADGAASAAGAPDRSPYLVRRLLETRDENLFNAVKFALVHRRICALGLERPRVLDIGCGCRVAERYLARLGLELDYFGVDYERRLGPDAVVDLTRIERVREALPWQPDVILALDVLEHLDEDRATVESVVRRLAALTPGNARLIVTLPQMYRLDRFKLPHLHYPEHKIRLTRAEWREVLETGFEIEAEQGLGYLSVLPYLPMASRRYRDGNRLGALFRYLRGELLEWPPLKGVDRALSNTLGCVGPLKSLSNDVLFVARRRCAR